MDPARPANCVCYKLTAKTVKKAASFVASLVKKGKMLVKGKKSKY